MQLIFEQMFKQKDFFLFFTDSILDPTDDSCTSVHMEEALLVFVACCVQMGNLLNVCCMMQILSKWVLVDLRRINSSPRLWSCPLPFSSMNTWSRSMEMPDRRCNSEFGHSCKVKPKPWYVGSAHEKWSARLQKLSPCCLSEDSPANL